MVAFWPTHGAKCAFGASQVHAVFISAVYIHNMCS
jgi:hypothetical protein